MRRRAYVYGHKREVVQFCKGDKSVISDSKTHKIYRCPHCETENPCPERKGKSRSPVLPAAVNLSNGPDSCSFCMNLLKLQEICLCITEKVLYLETYQNILSDCCTSIYGLKKQQVRRQEDNMGKNIDWSNLGFGCKTDYRYVSNFKSGCLG